MSLPYAEVIGDPIAHSMSPPIHKYWLAKLGIEGDYRALRVSAAELPAYLESRRRDPDWRGCNVTMPLKQQAMTLMETLDSSARRIGAVNTIVNDGGGLHGTNTDREGINLALLNGPIGDWSVIIVGAGGAARAALEEMRRARPARLTILNRSIARAQAMIDDFEIPAEVGGIGGSPAANLLINASPLGMEGFPPLELGLERMPADALVFEMVYRPLETALLRDARSRGLRTIDGLSMLIHQAAMAFAHFFGQSPEPAASAELRKLLTS